MASKHTRDAATWRVYFNGVRSTTAQVVEVQESAGGGRLDIATLEIDADVPIEGLSLGPQTGINTQTEITVEIDGVEHVRHWGKIEVVQPVVTPSEKRYRLTSRTSHHHFGRPLSATRWHNPITDKFEDLDLPLVFNPTIDGINEGNREPGYDGRRVMLAGFKSPESSRSAGAARLFNQGPPGRWSLPQAVMYLCHTLNPDQQYVGHPIWQHAAAVLGDNSALMLRDVSLRFGRWLPQLLDDLLPPLGFDWYVHKFARGRRRIRFFRRNTGGQKTVVYLQRTGQVFDPNKTNMAELGITYDIGRLANKIVGVGSRRRAEFTAELVRSWPVEQDVLTSEDLLLDDATVEAAGRDSAWRKWVLNEAGDYIGLRAEIQDAFDFAPIFGGPLIPRRRQLRPCLTKRSDGNPIGTVSGVLVEYWDNDLEEWRLIGNWGCQLLTRECGIYFASERPPVEIMRFGEHAKVRITACVDDDYAIRATESPRVGSPNADDVELVLNMPDRFHHRWVSKQSRFAEGNRETFAVDDRQRLADYCFDVRKATDAAHVGGPVHLEGCDHAGYEIGQRVVGVEGIGMRFNARLLGGEHYPQIVGITYRPQDQRTTLTLRQFKRVVTDRSQA